MPVSLVFRRLRQKDLEFQMSLGYTGRPSLKKQNNNNNKKKTTTSTTKSKNHITPHQNKATSPKKVTSVFEGQDPYCSL
jgi:hypothetical protein